MLFAIYFANQQQNINIITQKYLTMKSLTKIFATATIIIAGASASFAQATATASASATIITPITITKTADMNFGNVAVSATIAGTAILAPAGTRSGTGGVNLPATNGTVT